MANSFQVIYGLFPLYFPHHLETISHQQPVNHLETVSHQQTVCHVENIKETVHKPVTNGHSHYTPAKKNHGSEHSTTVHQTPNTNVSSHHNHESPIAANVDRNSKNHVRTGSYLDVHGNSTLNDGSILNQRPNHIHEPITTTHHHKEASNSHHHQQANTTNHHEIITQHHQKTTNSHHQEASNSHHH